MKIDATQTARAPSSSLDRRVRSLLAAPAVAGITYSATGVLLLVWVTGAGVAVARRSRSGALA
jgi:hypothetical protein